MTVGFSTILPDDGKVGRAAKGVVIMGVVWESSSWRNCDATFCNC